MYLCRKHPNATVQTYFWRWLIENIKEGNSTDTLLQGLLEKAIENPGVIYGAVRLCEGSANHCKRVEGVVKPVSELEKFVVGSRGNARSRNYDKHNIVRACLVDGLVRVSEIRLDITGDVCDDAKEWEQVSRQLLNEQDIIKSEQ
jgi:hypothetical protein